MLNLGVVASLLKTIEGYVTNDTMLIDIDGTIVSCSNKGRRGTVHALAHELVNGAEEKVIVKPDDSNHLMGNEPGVYMTLTVNQAKVGVLAVLSAGEESLSIVNIVKICIEKSLELGWTGVPRKSYLYRYPKTRDASFAWLLYQDDSGLSMGERLSEKPAQAQVWGDDRRIAPEAFVEVALRPGQTKEWTREWFFAK